MPPGLEEFRKLLEADADDAFKKYSLLIDCDSLDHKQDGTHDEFKRVKVAFTYTNKDGFDAILMGPDPNGKEAAYLPWKNDSEGGISKATLNGDGPEYFSTSQLDGCRFTLQYHDADRKVVTVQHLAGDHGGPGKAGSEKRDILEADGYQGLPATATPELKRRLSIGQGPGKAGRIGAAFKQSRADTIYYDGGKAAVFGYRNKAGVWNFFGAETDTRKGGAGLKDLYTQNSVKGSLKAATS